MCAPINYENNIINNINLGNVDDMPELIDDDMPELIDDDMPELIDDDVQDLFDMSPIYILPYEELYNYTQEIANDIPDIDDFLIDLSPNNE
jgi:hypothetical protein